MNKVQKVKNLLQILMAVFLMLSASAASANADSEALSQDAANQVSGQDVVGYLTDKDGKYTGPSVEQNVVNMDTDKNGFADVDEVRAYLQLKHGKDFQKNVLDRWLVAAKGHSCGTNFAKDLVDIK